MEAVFCDRETLLPWLAQQVASEAGKPLIAERRDEIEHMCGRIQDACAGRRTITCTFTAAADALTELFKGPVLFTGDQSGFMIRKRDVEPAAKLIPKSIRLLPTTTDHFRESRELFLAYCVRETKTAYAQFADYLDSAVVLNPPQGIQITHVYVGHRHVPYVLRKRRWSGTIIQ